MSNTFITREFQEKVAVVAVCFKEDSLQEVEEDLAELSNLVETAGALVSFTMLHRALKADPAYLISRGKVLNLANMCDEYDCDTVVFDNDLSPSQQRNLEAILGRTAISRTAVILDIFAQNAKSREGKLQVEAALSKYRLSRLKKGAGTYSQQVGRIGTRGPGETKLEMDRRRLRDRLARINVELRNLEKERLEQRKRRSKLDIPTVCLIGYTNAGKSTLFNALSKLNTLAENKLFATLDSKKSKIFLTGYGNVVLSDTVGFIKKLPHELIEAFKSTLDEVSEADLLLHVVNLASPNILREVMAVRNVVNEIAKKDIKEILVLNKADLKPEKLVKMKALFSDSIALSAKMHFGIDELLEKIRYELTKDYIDLDLVIRRDDVEARKYIWENMIVTEVHPHLEDDSLEYVKITLPKNREGSLFKKLNEISLNVKQFK